jgi:tetratricopeptide (TPR) repeat protein
LPDVHLIIAETESSPAKAVERYRVISDRYRSYPRLDLVLLRMCELHFLQSRWRDLEATAREGLSIRNNSHYDDFAVFYVISLIRRGSYNRAERECRRLIERNHEYESLARNLLILAYIDRRSSGFSRDYIATLRQIASGYPESDAHPATLYMLGEFYEQKKMYDQSYSAYGDLLRRFPESPEATSASQRIHAILQHRPRRVPYLPDQGTIENTDLIDIRPDRELPERNDEAPFYSISIGPFDTAGGAKKIRGLLESFEFLQTVRLRRGYVVYVGRVPDNDSALELRIRLAEEFGINGRIVRIAGDGRRSYIYGD